MSEVKRFYDKKIKYLEEIKDGERVGGAGFVKAEVRGEICKIFVQVTGLYSTDCFDKPVLLLYESGESSLCNLSIREGRGSTGEISCSRHAMGTNRISYEAITEIKIPLATGRILRCKWQEIPMERVISAERVVDTEQAADITQAANEIQAADVVQVTDAEQIVDDMQNLGRNPEMDDVQELQAGQELQAVQEVTLPQSEKNEPVPDRRTAFPLEDKWKQLWEIYPHITPFEDGREYLSIGPSDFVIFPSPYYRLINNSFLLHGYHNYGHLILWRTQIKGEVRYYIGVPGNYYEKEKQVAIMFGFESFECKTEPADWGVYGYYMMRVEV